MCVVIDVNGDEFHIPDEIILDSEDIRGTVQRLEAEEKLYLANRKIKREKRKTKKNILRRIFA